jgi:hypothetical protein
MGPHLLCIMAKESVPGLVKTRLSPPLDPGQAAALYRCMVEDTLTLAARVAGVRPGVAFTPTGSREWFSRLAPPGFFLLDQGEGGLGERLARVAGECFRRGAGAVCLLNSDGPDLPAAHLARAFAILGEGRPAAVFGPNPDGGYYLAGLNAPAEIFRGIPWSTGEVLERSLAGARAVGLDVHLLPPWPDLDTAEDLVRALERWDEAVAPPPRTHRLLRRLRRELGAAAGVRRP